MHSNRAGQRAGHQRRQGAGDLVIADCNKGDHAQSCAGNGMDQCDKVFPTPMVLQPGLVFGIGNAPQQPVASNNLKQLGIATHR